MEIPLRLRRETLEKVRDTILYENIWFTMKKVYINYGMTKKVAYYYEPRQDN